MTRVSQYATPTPTAGPYPVRPARRVAGVLLAIAILVVAAVAVTGWFHLRHEQAEARRAGQEMLAAVADLKVAQIVRWRNERLADATYIRRTPYAARRALDSMVDTSPRTRQMFTGWVDAVIRSEPYRRAILLDAQLEVRLVHPENASQSLCTEARHSAEQTIRSLEVVATDLHREAEDGPIHLDLLVPLVVRREGAKDNVPAAGLPPSAEDWTKAVLVLEANASDSLSPMIQAWPTPSRTAETLLTRREGDEVLFLSDLRHRKGAALSLRFPITEGGLPAAMGAQGHIGPVEGMDYRGVPVLAAIQPVPDTPWVIVAKMDQAEIYAPFRRQAIMTGWLVGLLLLAAVLGVGLVWRQDALAASRRELAERTQAEEALRKSEERYLNLFEMESDALVFVDNQTGEILEANQAACILYGYTRDEWLHLTPTDVSAEPEQTRRAVLEGLARISRRWHRKRDGTVFPVEITTNHFEWQGRAVHLAAIRDITERRQAEVQIEEQLDELRRWQAVMLDREDRVRELKQQINELRQRLGEPAAYPSQDVA